ncbi:putative ubiquitin carboxyl-terminal hydrolase 50 [Collichthys lucidus]|uniref:Putative ubiquitin carboxyl-terminal hydrolase 50 n=1 Tax=Collichthys lucidus TaxID=240159 RepID=A0A4U5VVW6_COLLU|nr:putative ubiquitin carboxyl-terminal hydrolase 50 [Collichthys lucidus]
MTRVEMFREKLDSLNISDYHGLNSPGVTCYLNSVLQVLFMTEDFREAVKGCSSEDSTTIDEHLRRLFSDLEKRVAKTHNITKRLEITNVYEQRDAAEYFEKILCRTSPEAAKRCEMTQNPEVLTLLLKRFTFDYKRRCYVKLHCKVDVPRVLHTEDCDYDLYALVNHFGNLTGGHYTAQIKSFETQVWYHFNDSIVKRVNPLFGVGDKSLRSSTAYLLMYRKGKFQDKPS